MNKLKNLGLGFVTTGVMAMPALSNAQVTTYEGRSTDEDLIKTDFKKDVGLKLAYNVNGKITVFGNIGATKLSKNSYIQTSYSIYDSDQIGANIIDLTDRTKTSHVGLSFGGGVEIGEKLKITTGFCSSIPLSKEANYRKLHIPLSLKYDLPLTKKSKLSPQAGVFVDHNYHGIVKGSPEWCQYFGLKTGVALYQKVGDNISMYVDAGGRFNEHGMSQPGKMFYIDVGANIKLNDFSFEKTAKNNSSGFKQNSRKPQKRTIGSAPCYAYPQGKAQEKITIFNMP